MSDRLICECMCVPRAEVERLAAAGRAVSEIVAQTAAGTNCGECMAEVRRITRRARWRRRIARLRGWLR